jgi:8-oxo-dGTP pyrophosphatase MutT (NUDIX family)
MAQDIHFTSEVFIVHKGKVLLRMHPNLKIWCSVGGHIDAGEDPNTAALREVKEEVGLDVRLWDGNKRFHVNDPHLRNLVPPVGLNRHTSYDGHEHVTFVFFATSETDAVVPEHENDEWRWVARDELDGMDLLPNIREYAEGALKELAS